MSNQVTMIFEAKDAAFLQKTLAIKNEMEATANSAEAMAEKMVKSGNKAAKSQTDFAESVQSSVGNVIASYAGIGAAIGVASKIWSAHLEEMGKKADTLKERTTNLFKGLGTTGQISEFGNIQTSLSGIKSDLFGAKDVSSLFSRISQKGGAEYTTAEKLAATRSALKAGDTGAENVDAIGDIYLTLAKQARPGGQFEGNTETDIANAATKIGQYKTDGLSDFEKRFFMRAEDKKQALNLLIAATKGSEPGRGLTALDEEITSEPTAEQLNTWRKKPHSMKHDDKAKKALFDLPENERLAALLNKPDVYASSKNASMIRNLAREYDPTIIDNAVSNDLIRQQSFDLQHQEAVSPELHVALQNRRLAVQKEQEQKDKEVQALKIKNAQDELQNQFIEYGNKNNSIVGNSYVRGALGYIFQPAIEQNVRDQERQDNARDIKLQAQTSSSYNQPNDSQNMGAVVKAIENLHTTVKTNGQGGPTLGGVFGDEERE